MWIGGTVCLGKQNCIIVVADYGTYKIGTAPKISERTYYDINKQISVENVLLSLPVVHLPEAYYWKSQEMPLLPMLSATSLVSVWRYPIINFTFHISVLYY